MRLRPVVCALVFLTSVCVSHGLESEPRSVSTSQFSVEYPPGGGWNVGIQVRGIFADEDPFDTPEEGIEFRRTSRSEVGGEPDSRVSITAQRQWPTIDECLVRPQDTRNQRQAIRRMERVFQNIKEGQSRMFVQDLEQCAQTVEEYAELHFAHAEFLFRESVAMMGGNNAPAIEEGRAIVGDKTIHFARFESFDRSTSGRFEISRYVYFPPTFGVKDLFYYEVFTSASCNSRESCVLLGDTKGPSLAVLRSLESVTGKAPSPISGEQVAAEEYFRAKLLPDDGKEFDKFGLSVDISGSTIAVAASCSLPRCSARGSTYIFGRDADADPWLQSAKLTAAEKKAQGYLSSVAIKGDTVAVGGHYGAHVFTRSGDTGHWDEQAQLSASGIEVAIADDAIVIGAAFENCLETSILCEGEAYVFHHDSATGRWIEPVRLQAGAPPPPFLFGSSVAVDGTTLAVGAPGLTSKVSGKWGSHDGEDIGAVYVFMQDDAKQEWSAVARLTPDDSAPRDKFGHSVAIDGDTLVVGAVPDRAPGTVYIFERDKTSGDWHQKQKLAPNVLNEKPWLMNHFGVAVAFDGNTLVVGASYESGLREYTGSAYIFHRDDSTGSWEQSIKLKAPDAGTGDHFGRSVAIEGTMVVVGAPDDSDNGQSSGSAYVFKLE